MIDKATGKAIGTIELFDKVEARRGMALYIDFAAPYETRKYLSELRTLADNAFFALFGKRYILIKAVPTAVERLAALRATGYEPFEWEGREHYYMKRR